MLFNSLQFAIFFPVVTALYFLVPHRFRWPMLLAASCYFYMAFIPAYILILFATIGIDYVAGIVIEGAEGRRRRLFLLCSILANIGVLATFKYLAFFNDSTRWLATWLGYEYSIAVPAIILPLGLSFHTFQSLSYTIEVYRGHQAAERHLGIFALYVLFYPQLVAGPIERPQNLLPQFRTVHRFDYDRVTSGLRMMAWGLFMKAVIADNLAPAVNLVYNDPVNHTGLRMGVATVFFAFQIYCDFAGYSLIALGSARVMGFRLMENFQQPYFSTSIAEFWRRWHISLSTWFRDYVYVPLGGNRVTPVRRAINLLIVLAVSGLWHGANWTFVIWGLLHGMYLMSSLATASARKWVRTRVPIPAPALWFLRASFTFALVCVAWVFFRANSVSDAFFILTHAWGGLETLRGLDLGTTAPALAGLVVLCAAEAVHQYRPAVLVQVRRSLTLRWAAYYALIVTIVFWGRFGQETFIYFQF